MSTYAIGDIHGNLTSLNLLIDEVQFTKEDTVVFLGDYIDRGEQSKEVLDRIIALRKETNVVTVRGNHEIMMMASRTSDDSFNFWQGYGGFETLLSYGHDFKGNWIDDIPVRHWFFLEDTLRYYENDRFIFVHASVHQQFEMYQQPDSWLFWNRFDSITGHISGKKVICGHTSQKSGCIAENEHAVCIDTWSIHKYLTCLNTDTGDYWQVAVNGCRRHDKMAL